MHHELLARDHSEIDHLFSQALAAIGESGNCLALVDRLWARLAVHIRAEHLHLFPTLSELAARTVDKQTIETIATLRADHDLFMKKFASIVKILRLEPGSSAIRDPLDEIHRRLESHNIVEETEIYPLVDELPEDVRYELIRRIQAELENAPPRFYEAGWRVT